MSFWQPRVVSTLLLSLVLPSTFSRAQAQRPTFSRISFNEGADTSFGCGWIDYDADGDLDLFVANLEAPSALFLNAGDGTLIRAREDQVGPLATTSYRSFGCSWGDYDNDGFPDLFLPNFDQPNTLYHNNGDGSLALVTEGPVVAQGGNSQGGGWADYDGDGYLDLFVANTGSQPNALYHNNGDGSFTAVTTAAPARDGRSSHGVAWGDYDDDGDLDLFVANNSEHEANLFYRNDGGGTFAALTEGPIVEDIAVSIGASWIDFDNDGDLDLFVTNSLGANNFLYRNEGAARFSRVEGTPLASDGGNSMGSCWGDYDNDGDLDLFVANSNDQANFLYVNEGEGTFIRQATGPVAEDTQASRGCSWGDYDEDGDLDLFVSQAFGTDDQNTLYANGGTAHHWLSIGLRGTQSNRSAIGASVSLKAQTRQASGWQRRTISSQTGAYGHNSFRAHFGLGRATSADTLRIVWPSGRVELYTDLAADRHLLLTEGDGEAASVSGRVRSSSGEGASVSAFVDVNLLPMDRERILAHQTVLVREGHIAAIGPTDSVTVPEGALVIDGRGRYLLPGLVDMHVHLFDPDELTLYLANGITTVRNLHGVPRHLEWREEIASGERLGPRFFTCGPILDGDPPTRGTNTVLHTVEEARQAVAAQQAEGYDCIKIYDNVPPLLYEALGGASRVQGLPMTGHVPTPVGIDGLLEAGLQAEIQHAEELLPAFDQGRDTTGLAATARALAEAGVWMTPTLAVYQWPLRQIEDLPALIESPEWQYVNPRTMQNWNWATTPPAGTNPAALAHWKRAHRFNQHLVVRFYEAGGKLMIGSDAPMPTMIPGFSTHWEVKAFVEAGLTPYAALEAATRNAAAFLQQTEVFGTIAPGKVADLLLLSANPLEDIDHLTQRVGVMVGGLWLTQQALKDRIDEIARAYRAEPE